MLSDEMIGENNFLVSSLFEAELERGRPFHGIDEEDSGDDFELDLEMNDLLDDFNGSSDNHGCEHIQQDMDIFAD